MTLSEAWERIDVVIDAWDEAQAAGASDDELAPLKLQFLLLEAAIGDRPPPGV